MSEQEVFLVAVELSDLSARLAYLDQACAGDLALRHQVEALLKVHDAAGDFLATPAIQQLSAQPASSDVEDVQDNSGAGEFEKTSRYPHDSQGHDEEVPLGFLSPSTKPGSLGQMGHYEVLEILGHGAFGIVLKAFDEKLHRIVAIKVMSPELASTSPPRKRFLREARASAAIRHENVVAVHAVEEQPIPYMVMEYIPGLTLNRALEEHGPLDVADVLRIGQQIANGLAAAHAQGLIHRDIKPANILLENSLTGRVKITDFGLARAADDASLTQSGTIAGTPMYMSPEQASTGQIDQRSDLFSLGSVMYVMISGRPPFRAATTLAVLRRVVEDTPRPIPEIIANVPSWLCAIIAKLQAKQPADRFATASELGELLSKCLADLQANRPVQLPAELLPTPAPTATPIPVEPVVGQRDVPKPNRRETAHQRRWPTVAAIWLLLFVGFGLSEATGVTQLTSTVIRLTTGSGILVIETDDPGIKVTIDGEEVQIRGAGVEQLTLKPGQYNVSAIKDGQPVSQQLVTITRGGKEVVRVTVELNAKGRQQATPIVSVHSAAADRAAAEYVLSIGGHINIKEEDIERQIVAVGTLPHDAFELTGVMLRHNTKVSDAGLGIFKDCRNITKLYLDASVHFTDAGLVNFKGCKNLTQLVLAYTQVSDAGLANFQGCQHVTHLSLWETQISDEGLAYFKECGDLVALHLQNSQVTNKGLAHFKHCRNLTELNLGITRVSDAGVAQISGYKKLAFLALSRTPVSDLGVAHLGECQQLTSIALNDIEVSDASLDTLASLSKLGFVNLKKTKVTEAGIKKLIAALPHCKIEWDGGVIEPTSSDPDRTAAEWVLSISGRIEIQENGKAPKRIEDVGDLPQGTFKLRAVDVGGNSKVSDAGLIHFQNCENLAELSLGKTQVSDVGLANFRDHKSITHLYLNATQVSDAGLAHFKNCTNLSLLFLDNTKVSDAGLAHFQSCKNLTMINLMGATKVTDAGLAHFKGCKNLTELYLSDTQVSDAGLVHFNEYKNLTTLYLNSPRVSDAGLTHLKDCKNLTVLRLNNTQVSDTGLERLTDFPNLKQLYIPKTKVTEAGVKKLSAALPRCKIEWDGGVIEPRGSSDGWQGWPKGAPPPAIAPFDAEQATKHQEAWATYLSVPVEYTNSVGMKFRLIPPGEFLMGSTPEERKTALTIWANDTRFQEPVESAFPRHRVILTQPIYFGIHEVTQAEYEQVMGKNPSHFSSMGAGKDAIAGMDTTRHPVENVSWNDAIEFCAKLSPQETFRLTDDRKITQALDGNGYRLPTEAEWEFACRAGTSTKYWIGDKDEDIESIGWMAVNSAGRTHRVGELKANPFGLYDVHGNVWEWMQGWWGITAYRQYQERAAVNPVSHFAGKPLRVTRGGAWSSSPYCPGWFRGAPPATMKENATGIRVVLTVDAVRQSLKRTGPALATVKVVPAHPDSAAAEYVLSIGGTIGVKEVRDELRSGTAGDVAQREFELTSVDLTANPMVSDAGLEHFRNCKHLTELRLGQTKVSDAGMVNFSASKNLTVLELIDTAVSDEGLAHFQDCKQLTYLNLSYCGRVHDAGLAYFKDCRKLETLALTHTEATDAGLANFQDCKELTMLALEGIQKLSDAGLVHFKNCPNLKRLLLAGTSIDGTGLANFSDCERLEYLDLNGTKVNDAGLANFKNCRHITTLLLITEMTDAGLAHFKECKDLVVLNIGSSQIGNAGLAHFKDCKDLVHLALTGIQVSDAGLAHLKDCKNLVSLRLKDLSVSDVGLGYFMDCKKLGNLDLTTAGVSDASLADLASLPNLTELNLEWTRISLRGYGQLKAALPNCHISWSELNRNVAENVLALGGTVEIGAPGQPESRPIQVAADLPDNFFQVRRVSLAGVVKPLYIVQQNLFWLHVPEFDRLEKLDLSGVSGFDYSVLDRVHGLQELSLVKSGLNDKSLAKLPKIPTLRRLVLDGNVIAGSGMSSLEKQSTLIELSLASAGLNDLSLAQLPKLPELQRLVLDGNEIRGGGIAVLKTQPELIDLSLGCPTLTDLTARQLTELKQIKRLSLAGSSLTDVGIKHLVGLTNLEFLDLRRTNATTTGINELKAALPKCQIQWDGMQDK